MVIWPEARSFSAAYAAAHVSLAAAAASSSFSAAYAAAHTLLDLYP